MSIYDYIKVGDVVYYVNDYKVIKCTIEEIITKADKNSTQTTYTLQTVKKEKGNLKRFSSVSAMFVQDLEVAKQSALTNWKTITAQVEKGLTNLKDSDFDNA